MMETVYRKSGLSYGLIVLTNHGCRPSWRMSRGADVAVVRPADAKANEKPTATDSESMTRWVLAGST